VNIPNLISLGRLLSVPVTVWLILADEIQAAFWLFIAAGISDGIDGFIAKRFNAESKLGRFLDPIADKALLVSVFITLGQEEFLQAWLVILVVFRDALIVGGALLFETLTHSLTMEPLKISKVNTVAQIILAATVLGFNGFGVNDPGIIAAMVVVVALTTVLSGLLYVVKWTDRAGDMEDNK
jgi:cardiolipin synthase